jgi:hypothetical protein
MHNAFVKTISVVNRKIDKQTNTNPSKNIDRKISFEINLVSKNQNY